MSQQQIRVASYLAETIIFIMATSSSLLDHEKFWYAWKYGKFQDGDNTVLNTVIFATMFYKDKEMFIKQEVKKKYNTNAVDDVSSRYYLYLLCTVTGNCSQFITDGGDIGPNEMLVSMVKTVVNGKDKKLFSTLSKKDIALKSEQDIGTWGSIKCHPHGW